MKKKIFIGSSTKASEKAERIKIILESFGAEVTFWKDHDVFPAGEFTISALKKQADKLDGAVFILNKDDKLESPKNGKQYIPRDNVLVEAGLFIMAHGIESVALIQVNNTHIPSDFDGITTIKYNTKTAEMAERLNVWYHKRDVVNNICMKSRKEIHEMYPLDDRLHITDDIISKSIQHIRIMNLAGNIIINPKYAMVDHINSENIQLSDAIEKILENTNARIDLILLEPNENTIEDIRTKIANDTAGSPEGAVYSSLATMYRNLYGKNPTVYKTARQDRRFFFKVMTTSMPFAIFNVVFSEDNKQYNHVKIDLYSAHLSDENKRRSFVIWKESDPENYDFFVQNFDNIYKYDAERVTEKKLKEWDKEWKRRQNLR